MINNSILSLRFDIRYPLPQQALEIGIKRCHYKKSLDAKSDTSSDTQLSDTKLSPTKANNISSQTTRVRKYARALRKQKRKGQRISRSNDPTVKKPPVHKIPSSIWKQAAAMGLVGSRAKTRLPISSCSAGRMLRPPLGLVNMMRAMILKKNNLSDRDLARCQKFDPDTGSNGSGL